MIINAAELQESIRASIAGSPSLINVGEVHIHQKVDTGCLYYLKVISIEYENPHKEVFLKYLDIDSVKASSNKGMQSLNTQVVDELSFNPHSGYLVHDTTLDSLEVITESIA